MRGAQLGFCRSLSVTGRTLLLPGLRVHGANTCCTCPSCVHGGHLLLLSGGCSTAHACCGMGMQAQMVLPACHSYRCSEMQTDCAMLVMSCRACIGLCRHAHLELHCPMPPPWEFHVHDPAVAGLPSHTSTPSCVPAAQRRNTPNDKQLLAEGGNVFRDDEAQRHWWLWGW